MKNLDLYSVHGAFGTQSISPFCVKLEAFLRIQGIDYKRHTADFTKAPKGKVPYVAIDGEIVGDSQHVIDRVQKLVGKGVDATLTPEQVAIGHAMRRTFEDGFYYVLVYDRWFTDDGWAAYKPHFALSFPSALRGVLPPIIRRQVKKTLHAQGTGRHTRDEVIAMGVADLESFARVLGDKPFMFGDEPTSFDAAPWAMIDGVRCFPRKGELAERLEAMPTLVAYHERLKARLFPAQA